MQNKNKMNSPIKTPPLRYPGQSLQEELYDIMYDGIIPRISCIVLVFLVAFYDLARLYFNTPPQPLFLFLVGLAISAYYFKELRSLGARFQNVKTGRDGERAVGQSLEELREKGYKVYHDLIDAGFNIDHILVGPGGVFMIETKTRNISNEDINVLFNGTEIVINGYSDKKPLIQAKNQAVWLERFIADAAKTEVKVKPVLIYAGKRFVKQMTQNTDIWVLNIKALPTYLANAKVSLDAEQIKLISSHIESYIRNYKDDNL